MKCKSYSDSIESGSKAGLLLDRLRGAGVGDADLDSGYHQIDYYRPGRRGDYVGAGDCVIEEREVVRYAIERWRDYRAEIEGWMGGVLPWDYDPRPAATTGTESSRGESCVDVCAAAASMIGGGLEAMGVEPGSDRYLEAITEGIFYVMHFPVKGYWDRWDAVQRCETWESMGQVKASISPEIKRFVEERGGCGWIYDYSMEEISGRTPSKFNMMMMFERMAYQLYYMYERAGLDPSFVEIAGREDLAFACDQIVPVRLGVAIRLSSGLRVFDPSGHDEDSHALFYPLSMRQAVLNRISLTEFMTSLFSQKANELRVDDAILRDGFGPAYRLYTNAAMFTTLMESREEAGEASSEFIASMHERSRHIHPLILFTLLLGEGKFDELSEHPALKDTILCDFARVFYGIMQEDVDADAVLPPARAILDVDPDCFIAHVALAYHGSSAKEPLSPEEIGRHYEIMTGMVPPDSLERAKLDARWGHQLVEEGELSRAEGKCLSAWMNEAGTAKEHSFSGYYLAWIRAQRGEVGSAASYLNGAGMRASDYLSDADDSTTVNFYDWLKGNLDSRPFPKEAMKSYRMRAGLHKFTSSLGERLLFHGHAGKAVEMLSLALENSTKSAKLKALCDLEEAYLQAGDLAKADEIRERIEEHAGMERSE